MGIIPYQLPSSVELAEATIKELHDYDVVMWEKHGVFAVDCDADAAFDQIDVLNKSALIYIAAKNMGFEPDGMSQVQMKEMSVAFNFPSVLITEFIYFNRWRCCGFKIMTQL